MHDYSEDDDMPPPPKELMTPQMMASPVSRPHLAKFSRFTHAPEHHPLHHRQRQPSQDEHSLISYDAPTTNGEEEENRLPELLSPILPNERAIDVPSNFNPAAPSTPQQHYHHHHNNHDSGGAPSTPQLRHNHHHNNDGGGLTSLKREYRASHIITSVTEKRSPELRHCASTEGYARYTTPLSSVPPPNTGTRMSSQRRLPYTTAIATVTTNPLNSPLTPRFSSFNTSGRLERWGGQRLDLDDSLVSYETSNEYVPESGFERFAKRLQAKLATEQNRLRDAKATIQYWRKRESNQQSWNEICAHALLLLSEIRIKTYRELITRVNTFHHMNHGPPPISIAARSVYTVYRMDIALSREYYLKNAADDPNYVFILVGSTSEKTVASQLIELSDTALIRSRRFHIDEEMVFKNLPLNFRIVFSLYVMKIEQRSRTPKAFAKKMAVSLFNKFTPPVPNHNTSIGSRNESDDISTGFELAASFVLSRTEIGHFTAFFDDPAYPLDGSADINSKVSALPPQLAAEVKGIWTFFAETSIFVQYVEMKDGLIRCYDVPDDLSQLGEVKSSIDCSTICNCRIVPGNPVSEYQYTFEFEVVVFPRGQEDSTTNNYVVAVETEEELQKWINSINTVLEVIRGK